MSTPTPGFTDSVRTLGSALLATLRDRIELLTVELHEEKLRLIQTFVWISLAMFSGVMAATFVTLTVVYLFWETARLPVLAGFALLYTGIVIAVIVSFRRFLARQPRPLEATLQELHTDQTCIRPES